MSTVTLTYLNQDGDDEEVNLPSHMDVCGDCEGHGTVMNESMRNHAYSSEEFAEEFPDDEDREQYFKRGGIYDVECPTCHGKNVVPVVDEESLTAEQKAQYEVYLAHCRDMAADRAEERHERMMGY
jgi:DnaJ-class molecular chaperone